MATQKQTAVSPTVASDAIAASLITAEAHKRNTNLSFLLKDFEKVFDMYIYHHGERSEAIKMYITLSTAPFIVMTAFGIAKNITFDVRSTSDFVNQFPRLVSVIFAVFGFAGIIPFHRFIAAHCNTYKMIRYMNGYRLFYFQLIKDEIRLSNWNSPIEKDPRYPIPKLTSLHWTNILGLIMILLNVSYFSFGLSWMETSNSTVAVILAFIVGTGLHILLAKLEFQEVDVKKLSELSVPVDAIIKATNT